MRAFILLLVACSEPAKAETPKATSKISVSGELGGKPFSFSCDKPGSAIADDTYALRTDEGKLMLACADPKTQLSVSLTVKLVVGKIVPAADESNGRVGLVVPPSKPDEPPLDIITTSSQSRANATRATGTVEVKEYKPTTGRGVGKATMKWKKDIKGKPGNATITFDLTLR